MKRQTIVVRVLTGIMAVLLLAGCGSDPEPPTTTPIAVIATSTGVAVATATTVPAATATSVAVAPTDTASTITIPVPGTPAAAGTCTRLNLNQATVAQLVAAIPGMNESLAQTILGQQPYFSISQFRNALSGVVDESVVAALEQYVYVPIELNDADAETLMQIPGLDATEAAAVLAGRPYLTTAELMAALAGYLAPEELVEASCFLATN